MSEKTQAERFADAAAAVDADPDEVAFRDKLALIARQKPAAHVITAADRKLIDREMAGARPPVVEPTLDEQLAQAEADLAAASASFDAYTGNNPRKYQAKIRRCATHVATLRAALGRKT